MDPLNESSDSVGVPQSIAAADAWRMVGRILRRRRPGFYIGVLEILEAMVGDPGATGESGIDS